MHDEAIVTAALLIINLVVSGAVLKLLDRMRKEFTTRAECEGKHALVDERHHEINRRLEKASI